MIVQEDKFTRLAEAIPADKYTWRPVADVRPFAEVFMHVSAANYNLYNWLVLLPPSGFDGKTFEKSTTDKIKVIAALKDSFAHAKAAIKAMPDDPTSKFIDWFGGKNTQRGVLLFIVRHAARAPWTIHRLHTHGRHHAAVDRGCSEKTAREKIRSQNHTIGRVVPENSTSGSEMLSPRSVPHWLC